MDKIREFLHSIEAVIEPVWNHFVNFCTNEWYIIYACIAFIMAIVIIAGIIGVFKKMPKFFLFLLFLAAIVGVASYFLIYK